MEQEWQECRNPLAMLAVLAGKATDRKLRLFCVACCRRVAASLPDRRCHDAVAAAEGFAEGSVTAEELQRAWEEAVSYFGSTCVYGTSTGDQLARAVTVAADPNLEHVDWLPGFAAIGVINRNRPPGVDYGHDFASEYGAHAALLHCIIGNPYRPFVADPSWRTFNDGSLVKLATAIYDGRCWDELPLLADALEEAGCTDARALAHCRGPGPHARGCHVLDAILGRS